MQRKTPCTQNEVSASVVVRASRESHSGMRRGRVGGSKRSNKRRP